MTDKKTSLQKLIGLLSLPLADKGRRGDQGTFNPWDLFPMYGGYCGSFDECAIDVLKEILSREKIRDDLGAEMFREMLCFMDLCDYGMSPRYCFPTQEFEKILPLIIEKWRAYSSIFWEDDED